MSEPEKKEEEEFFIDIAYVDATLKKALEEKKEIIFEDSNEKEGTRLPKDKKISIKIKPSLNSEEKIEDKPNEKKYTAEIKTEKFDYIGYLTRDIKRIDYGYNEYHDSNHYYFGEWKDDEKNGMGIYSFLGGESKELYYGTFAQGKKEGPGIYFWDCSANKMDILIGHFADDKFEKGISVRFELKSDKSLFENYTTYIGKLSDTGKREDTKAIFVENNFISRGEFKEDDFCKGRVIAFKENEKKWEKEYSFNFDKEGNNFNADFNDELDTMLIEIMNTVEKMKEVILEIATKDVENEIVAPKKVYTNYTYGNIEKFKEEKFEEETKFFDKVKKISNKAMELYGEYEKSGVAPPKVDP